MTDLKVSQRAREAAAELAKVVLEHIATGTGSCIADCFTEILARFETSLPPSSHMSPEAFDRAQKHHYWGAGEPDCPREIKAGNGELHTLRCKVCGLDDPRNPICGAALALPPSGIAEMVREMCAAKADQNAASCRREAESLLPGIGQLGWLRAAEEIGMTASAIRSLYLSNKGAG